MNKKILCIVNICVQTPPPNELCFHSLCPLSLCGENMRGNFSLAPIETRIPTDFFIREILWNPCQLPRVDKDAVAEVLKEIGVLLELKGENPFKTRAYVNGARVLEGLTEPLETLIAEERLGDIKGIGKALVEKITELVETGELEYYDTLKASIPPGLIEMLDVQGMGPKKVKALHEKLGLETIKALEAACEAGKVAELDGFGKKSEEKILESIAFKRQHASHHHRHKMLIAAEPILDDLRSHPDVIRCDIAGSLRRAKEVSGDIDFLVSAKESADIIEAFTTRAGVLSVLAAGSTKASVLLEGGIQADLRVVEDSLG